MANSFPILLSSEDLAEIDMPVGRPFLVGALGFAKSGEVWVGPKGRCLILGVSTKHVVFVALDGNQAGRAFLQETAAFASDLRFTPVADGARRALFAAKLVEYELQFIAGVVSVCSGVGFVAVTGSDLIRFFVQHRHQIQLWRRYISALLKVRRVLKKYAPTLWDKIVNRLLLFAWNGAKAAVAVGGEDVLANMPEAALTNPQVVGRGLGMIAGTLGAQLLNARLGALRLILSILSKILAKTVAAGVAAVKMTINEHAAEAREIVEAIRTGGASLTVEEAQTIMQEVQSHASEVKDALAELARAFQ